MSAMKLTRREALEAAGLLMAGSSVAQGRQLAADSPVRLPPRDELVNVLEFEDQAKRKLSKTAYSAIAGSERVAFDLITLRPRMVINCMNLDLTTELLGETMFAPILVGPVSRQRDFHPEGELATARGAAAAKAVMVVSGRSSYPIEQIAAQTKTTLWYQVSPDENVNSVRTAIQKAVSTGCRAVCITVGQAPGKPNSQIDWNAIDEMRRGINVPVVLKGIMTPEDATAAVQKGVQGIVVSSYGTPAASAGRPAPIEVLPKIVTAVGGKVPILIDGSFRRGADFMKALALGARAVLVGRPPMWGLAAYGADGVQTVIELLQTDLARTMAGSGKPTVKTLDHSALKIHVRAIVKPGQVGSRS